MSQSERAATRGGGGEPDAGLLARVREGDMGAYDDLYRRYVDESRMLASRYSPQMSDIDDIVAASFTDILQAIRRGAGPLDTFRDYLQVCVRRNGMRYLRQAWTVPIEESFEREALSPPIEVDDRLDAILALDGFGRLPLRWQQALWYRFVEDQSLEHVGERLGISANATSSLLARAIEGLRQAYLAAHLTTRGAGIECGVSNDRLVALIRGRTRGLRQRKLTRHIRDCPVCRPRLAEIEQAERALLGQPTSGPVGMDRDPRRGLARSDDGQ